MRPIRSLKTDFLDEDNNLLIATYILTQCKTVIEDEDIIVYGIQLNIQKEGENDGEKFSIDDISSQKNVVEQLINLMKDKQVTTVTALDIIEDFLE